MKIRGSVLTAILMSTAALGTLTTAPFAELQAKAQVTKQAKSRKPVTAQQTAAATAASANAAAIRDQLAAKGVKYAQLTAAQKQNAYVEVIVELQAAPATENGTINPTTSSTAQIQAATQRVIASQKAVKARVAAITHQGVGESYGYVLNGFATQAKVQDLSKLEALAGVKSVAVSRNYYPDDASANDMANVSTVWSNYKYKGQGTVVAVIDTGIDPTHKDLRLSNPNKVKLTRGDVSAFIKKAGYGRYYTAKVPYGHNYADNNEVITDDNPAEQHGMHVAGIIGANGTGTNPLTSAIGVAPEAQLLAMKAFSNSAETGGADTPSVISAIEDSSKLGADVLNLSLGSESGEQDADDPELAAVDNAVASGTAAVIAAGNAGTSGSDQQGNNTDEYGNPDLETIGAPGVDRDATTVASAENNNAINDAVTISAAGKAILGPSATEPSTGTTAADFSGKQFYFAKDPNGQLGVGTPDDYTAAAKGKIAVVLRGSLPFTQKQANAQAAGAAGLIIINNAGGDAPMTSMTYAPNFPTLGLSTEDGEKFVAYLAQNPTADLTFKIGLADMKNTLAETDKMSTFTSYGPTSSLDFKPDITAPGGNIWSTQNGNKYTNMSGTSMATPFIAGSQALLTEAMEDKTGAFYNEYRAMDGDQKAAFMKTIEMNTAQSVPDVQHGDVPVSPRRQGAGMVDVNAAISAILKNPSTVTGSNGYPGIELRAFSGDTHSFALTFTNRTKHALTYKLNQTDAKLAGIYTSVTDPNSGTLYDQAINGASIKADDAITIPAGQQRNINFTLTLPQSFASNQYVEGFLNFTGSDASKLSIPYMGYFGDWGAPEMFDPLDGQAFSPATGNLGTIVDAGNAKDGKIGYAGLVKEASGAIQVDPNDIALSTNKSAEITWLQPEFFLMRNANNVKAQILDSHGKLLTQLATFHEVTKSYWDANAQAYEKFSYAPKWDGTYYDAATNKYKKVPDGSYTYRVIGTVDGTNETQHYDIPIKVDSVKPQVRNLKLVRQKNADGSKSYTLTAQAKDNFSGLSTSVDTSVNGVTASGVTDSTTGTTQDGYSKIAVALSKAQVAALEKGKNDLDLSVYDIATNKATIAKQALKPGNLTDGLVVDEGGLPRRITTTTTGYQSGKQGNFYTISGTVPTKPYGTYTDAHGQRHNLKLLYDSRDHSFTGKLPLSTGDYHSDVILYADKAKQAQLDNQIVKVDLLAPTFNQLAVDGKATYTGKTKLPRIAPSVKATTTITGTVSADTTSLTVAAGSAQPQPVTLTAAHTFSLTLPVNYGNNPFVFTATNKYGNVTTLTQNVNSDNGGVVAKGPQAVSFDHGVVFGVNSVNTKTKGYDAQTGTLTVTGKVARKSTTLVVAGKSVAIKPNLTFKLKLHVGTHASAVFPILVGDRAGKAPTQEQLTFYVDGTGPSLTLQEPKVTAGSKKYAPVYTNQADFKLTGTMRDSYPYYALFVNQSEVDEAQEDVDNNAHQPLDKAFTEDEQLQQGKNVFRVQMADYGGNLSPMQTLVVYYQPQKALSQPKVTVNTKRPAEQVKVTAKAVSGETFEYSTNNGRTYQKLPKRGLKVTQNEKILIRATDKFGDTSKPVTEKITNIEP